jgi:hypothetical protein
VPRAGLEGDFRRPARRCIVCKHILCKYIVCKYILSQHIVEGFLVQPTFVRRSAIKCPGNGSGTARTVLTGRTPRFVLAHQLRELP